MPWSSATRLVCTGDRRLLPRDAIDGERGRIAVK
jgi:hypothetical protein